MMRKAFTLMEMIVALGIMALVLSFAGVIFRVSIESQRLAMANAEILQKYRTITEQLDNDFRGLCRDGEIFIVWAGARKPAFAVPDPNDPTGAKRNNPAAFERFDRIMFFTSGDFQAYQSGSPNDRGNVARVCYTLARGPSAVPTEPNRPELQKPSRRMLARTQHILLPHTGQIPRFDPSTFDAAAWQDWSRQTEIDLISLAEWKQLPTTQKINILSVIGDIDIKDGTTGAILSTVGEAARGVLIDRSKENSMAYGIQALLCEGVGQFMVQGWGRVDPNQPERWIPEVNPNGDGSLDDSDFPLKDSDLDPNNSPVLWYPRGSLTLQLPAPYPLDEIDEEHFRQIPGLGPALKFTFTLYDSRGLFKSGRTFTHIVYLDI
jgi:prepilin-type N-terminal cleavage/methylation domain-containing protein